MSEPLPVWGTGVGKPSLRSTHKPQGLSLDVYGQRSHDELGSGDNISHAQRIIFSFSFAPQNKLFCCSLIAGPTIYQDLQFTVGP